MTENELKPCPFCGGTNWRATNDEFTCVTCNDCGTIITFDFRFIEETNLNTRPIEDALQERIVELEAENEALREAQRWIPVEERLPEEGDIYQVVKQSEAGAYTTHCYYYGNGLWDVMSDQVSHWMNDFPLPDGSK